ncbi:MAG TPA: hypothetical protein VJI52_04040 [Candidatus Nanoarchaeia archaeon]|nr:hypothetical protein [Candidatus Nanoarchaeia archaeon]
MCENTERLRFVQRSPQPVLITSKGLDLGGRVWQHENHLFHDAGVAARTDIIRDQLRRGNLPEDMELYIRLAGLTGGKQGDYNILLGRKLYRVRVNGEVNLGDRSYGRVTKIAYLG